MITRREVIELARTFAPAVAVLAGFAAVLRWDYIDWGDAPSWVAAILTGGALLIAALAYRGDRARLAREETRLEEERLERVRAAEFAESEQARQVRIYLDEGGNLVVHNKSDRPIDDVAVYSMRKNYDDNGEPAYPSTWMINTWLSIPPETKAVYASEQIPELELALESRFNLQARFMDADSRSWRLIEGELIQGLGGLPWE